MEVRIHWKYKTLRGVYAELTSDMMRAQDALVFAEDMQKTGRVQMIQFLDRHDSYWTLKELKKYLQEIETEPDFIRIYFDGGYHHDTGQAGIGAVLYFEQHGQVYRRRANLKMQQLTSNNEAEFAALQFALQQLEFIGAHHVEVDFYNDSYVVMQEMSGEWPVTDGVFQKWVQRIENHIAKLGIQTNFHLISRMENKEADRLATQALEGTVIEATVKMS